MFYVILNVSKCLEYKSIFLYKNFSNVFLLILKITPNFMTEIRVLSKQSHYNPFI